MDIGITLNGVDYAATVAAFVTVTAGKTGKIKKYFWRTDP